MNFKYENYAKLSKSDQELIQDYCNPEFGDIYISYRDTPVTAFTNESIKELRTEHYIPLFTIGLLMGYIEVLTKGKVKVLERDNDFVNIVVVKENELGHRVYKGPKFTESYFDALFFVFMELLRGNID